MEQVYIRVTMPDGSQWDVDALPIAQERATYYADLASKRGSDYQTVYDEEFAWTLKDEDTLLDHAANNIDWSDVSSTAQQVARPTPPDYQEGWVNGEKRVIRKQP